MIVLAATAAADKPRDTREFAEELVSRIERFSLWNDCRPIRANASLRSDDSDIPEDSFLRPFGDDLFGLSYFDVMSDVDDRLREAHLLDAADAATLLFLRVHVTGNKVRVEASYSKRVRDLVSGLEWFAATWESKSVGEHGNNGNYILSQVMEELDKFIDEYLRVNRDACEKRPPTR